MRCKYLGVVGPATSESFFSTEDYLPGAISFAAVDYGLYKLWTLLAPGSATAARVPVTALNDVTVVGSSRPIADTLKAPGW